MGKSVAANTHRKATVRRNIHGLKSRFKRIRTGKYELKGIVQGVAITVVIAFLFYRSYLGLIAGLIIVPFWEKQVRWEEIEKKKSSLHSDFKEFMSLIGNSLQAGYSLEKAMVSAEEELKNLIKIDSILLDYVHEMNQKIAINTQVEKAFDDMANALDLEDAKVLSQILSFSKRSGGDYGKHILYTASKLEDRLMIEKEIDTMTSEKRLELKVMTAMPLLILAYISVTSKEFIAPLYKNLAGVIVMTICLFIYGAMVLLAKRVIKIEV